MHINGFDAMRWLGADPRFPADDVERVLALKLNNRVVAEQRRIEKAGG